MPVFLRVYAYVWETLTSINYHGFLVLIIRLFLSSASKPSSKHLLGNDSQGTWLLNKGTWESPWKASQASERF